MRFSELKVNPEKRGKCPVCGKWTLRRKKMWQTENPWNRNKDGSIRTRAEIYDSLIEEARNWVPDFTHEKCRDGK